METRNKIIITVLLSVIAGIFLGWLIFRSPEDQTEEKLYEEIHKETVWTCSMHPQIRQSEPGDCPICGMELIPLEEETESEISPQAVRMSPTAIQLANIRTATVGAMAPEKIIRLNGKVQTDERLIYSQSSHIPGRIENLMINFTGEYVNKGDVIASVYSPELVTAQEELFEAQKIKETQAGLFQAAKDKLKNWKLTDEQIEQILQAGASKEIFDIQADVSGYVTQKMINTGDYVNRGETIFEIADLSRVWVLFDVYESDMKWINKGDRITFTVSSLPGRTFKSTITFIDPVIDPQTRVAKARAEIANRNLQLKPEMFASGTVEAELPARSNAVVVPRTAVMWTGKRSVVYVSTGTEQGISFRMREVTLGPALGESFIVEDGLEEGEEIAVNGTFSIDAAAQLAGKPSMMNPEGAQAMTGHDHGIAESLVIQEKPVESFRTDPAFKEQLTDVFELYTEMKNAFVESNAEKVAEKAELVKKSLDATDMSLLTGEPHMVWMDQLETLRNTINAIAASSEIDIQRKAYANFSRAFYKSIKMFGLSDETAYYQYCPMAFDNQGAFWLSETEEIRNPYFGNEMLKCGETREIIKSSP